MVHAAFPTCIRTFARTMVHSPGPARAVTGGVGGALATARVVGPAACTLGAVGTFRLAGSASSRGSGSAVATAAGGLLWLLGLTAFPPF